MANFRKRLQSLVEKTTNSQLKNIIGETLNENLGQSENTIKNIILSKISKLDEKDSVILEFESRLNRDLKIDNLGIKNSIEELKEFTVNDPGFIYRFKAFEMHVNSLTPDYLIIESFMNTIKPFTFNEKCKSVYENLQKQYEDNKSLIELKKSYFELSNSPSRFMFENLIDKIQEYIESPSTSLKNELLFEMQRYSLPSLSLTMDLLKKENLSLNENSIEVFTNSEYIIENVVSPIFVNEDTQYFSTKRNVYSIKNGVLSIHETTNDLPEPYKNLLSSFNQFVVEGNSLVKRINKNKISFNVENKEITLNETKIDNISKLHQMGVFEYNNQFGLDLNNISENADLIMDIDFAKSITSKNVEAGIELFKFNESIYATKWNPVMGINEFSQYTVVNIIKEAKEFLGIDLSDTFAKEYQTDSTKIKSIEEEQKVIKESIELCKSQSLKLDEVLLKAPSKEDEVTSIQEMLNEEIESLQEEWNILEKTKFNIINSFKVNEDKKYDNVNSLLSDFKKYGFTLDRNIDGLYYNAKGKAYDLDLFLHYTKPEEDITDTTLFLGISGEEVGIILTGYSNIVKFLDKGLTEILNSDNPSKMDKICSKYKFESMNESSVKQLKDEDKILQKLKDKGHIDMGTDGWSWKKTTSTNKEQEIKENELNEGYSTGDKVKLKGGGTGEITAVNDNDSTVDVLKDDGKTSTYSFDQIESREKELKKEEDDNEGIEDKPEETYKE